MSMDREGCSQTLPRNYLLPINNNLEQAEDETSVEGVEPIDELTPVSQAYNELLADCPSKSQPESPHNSPPKQHEPVDPESTGSATQAWQMTDPRLAFPACSTKVKCMHNKKPTPMEVLEFCATVE